MCSLDRPRSKMGDLPWLGATPYLAVWQSFGRAILVAQQGLVTYLGSLAKQSSRHMPPQLAPSGPELSNPWSSAIG